MTLVWLVLIPLLGGCLAWLAARRSPAWARWISLVALFAELALLLVPVTGGHGRWLAEVDLPWAPPLGIRFHLAMDGLSFALILLTAVLGILSVLASWTEITEKVGFFHFNLLLTLTGVVGVFLALDLLLFFFFWELMLIPMYFLIVVWGHERRVYAAIKFFLFTQGGGLLLLIAILTLSFLYFRQSHVVTFDYLTLLKIHLSPGTDTLLMLGFFIAFAVKLPAVPFHTWLPDAHTEAPTAGSVVLAGLLLKTGAYGLLRFVIPLFPDASVHFAPFAMGMGVAGIIYGATLAFAQTDLKRLVAYSSVSHLGFVLLGIYAWNGLALQGVVMQMLAHGLSTGALFILVGALQERLKTRDMGKMGGLWTSMPRLAAIAMFFAVASLGLPGLGDFVGEFLVLLGTYRIAPAFAAAAAAGLVASALYALLLIQRVFHGPPSGTGGAPPDLAPRHLFVMGIMMAGLVWFGMAPQPVFDAVAPGLDNITAFARIP